MAENCGNFDNTEMEDNKDVEDNNVLLESNKDSSENSSDSTSRHVKDRSSTFQNEPDLDVLSVRV